MWISRIKLENFKSFSSADVQLSNAINLIVGSNNSGKTTLLQSILWLQNNFKCNMSNLRLNQEQLSVKLEIKDISNYSQKLGTNSDVLIELTLPSLGSSLLTVTDKQGAITRTTKDIYCLGISNEIPSNFIYPYLSKRKVFGFSEIINNTTVKTVTGNFENLYAKIDRLSSNSELPDYEKYVRSCTDILEFQVRTTHSQNGKKAGYTVSNISNIPLDAMGEGISNLLGLIVDLCVAENQLFLIEEPENDIHPKALKKLLGLIVEKSKNNQFIITTHSNIVTKYLGAQPDSNLFQVTMEFNKDRLPTSYINQVENTPQARRNILEDLGYELYDFDLSSAWLILEESSAERIIKDYLIPWFVPELKGVVRTVSANSKDKVQAIFDDFNNLFLFLHLEPIYKNKAWVIIDGGDTEEKIIQDLKNKYKGWSEDHFKLFSKHDFESYYPEEFKEKVEDIGNIKNSALKGGEKKDIIRIKKRDLINDVVKWSNDNPVQAKAAFAESASEVINILRQIKCSLNL